MSERVGSTRLFEWGSCRRDELDYLQIQRGRGKSGAPECVFVRKDGRVALRIAAFISGKGQLETLANFLGLPLYDTYHL